MVLGLVHPGTLVQASWVIRAYTLVFLLISGPSPPGNFPALSESQREPFYAGAGEESRQQLLFLRKAEAATAP